MPVYEYQCSACKRIEEAFQKISDPPLAVCPDCKGNLEN
jgi:putative FmdB family regulatory protein